MSVEFGVVSKGLWREKRGDLWACMRAEEVRGSEDLT